MKKRNILLSSKTLVALTAVVLFVLGSILIAQGMVDTRAIRTEVQRNIKELTGKDLVVGGNVTVSLLPVPTVYLPNVQLRDEKDNTQSPLVAVELISLRPSLGSLFSGTPEVGSMTLTRPRIEMERDEKGIVRWEWLTPALMKNLVGAQGSVAPLSIAVEDGQLLYRTSSSMSNFQAISASLKTGEAPSVNGTLFMDGHALAFEVDIDAGTGAKPFFASLTIDGENSLQIEGALDWSGELPKTEGKFALDFKDMLALFTDAAPAASAQLGQITNQSTQLVADTTVLPVKLVADWKQEGENIVLGNVKLDAVNSAGSGDISVKWGAIPDITMALDFTTLDAGHAQLLGSRLLKKAATYTAPDYYQEREAQPENPLPKDIRLVLDIQAEQFYVGAQAWKDADIQIDLSDASVTVNRFHIQLPGESTLSLFGLISQGNARTLRFEGSMETEGKSLRDFLTVFDESASDLPASGFDDFYARANIFVSPEQMRLSEADVKISDLRLRGGMVAYYDGAPRVEAEVSLADINFDYFRDAWRERKETAEEGDFFLKFDRNMSFNWLKKLRTSVDFKVAVDGFTFLDRPGKNASFRLFAKEGEFGIYNMRFYYPEDVVEANFHLDVKREQPFVNFLINANRIDLDYFAYFPAAPKVELPEDKPEAESDVSEPAPVGEEIPPPAEGAGEAAPAPAPETEAAVPADDNTVAIIPQARVTQEMQAVPVAAAALNALSPSAQGPAAATVHPRWSEDLIDMSWMDGINGQFDISINKLISGQTSVDRFKMSAGLEDKLLTFRSLSFAYWQGRCEVSGAIYGGKVPGISVGFTLYNAELRDMLGSFADRENISGRISVSGTLATSGVNYLSWLSQSDSKLVISGRGVEVGGFNLEGVADTVAVSRTAADVFNNVNRVLTQGSTQMSVDGNINIKNGVMRTPGITLKSGTIVGNLTGEVKLVPWTMELTTLFQFPTMTSETIPTMRVDLSGPIDTPGLQTDTASLEAYVAKRITGR